MRRKNPSRRQGFGEQKIEGEKGNEKLYVKREKTGDDWIEDSRIRNRRTIIRRDRSAPDRRFEFEEYREAKPGQPVNSNKLTFFVPKDIYKKQLKKQKNIDDVVGESKGMVELINRRLRHEKGRRARDNEEKK